MTFSTGTLSPKRKKRVCRSKKVHIGAQTFQNLVMIAGALTAAIYAFRETSRFQLVVTAAIGLRRSILQEDNDVIPE
jgi:hypothetical protein